MQVRQHSPQDIYQEIYQDINQDKNISGQQLIRIGFTVSRKVGNAIQRNRAKRRLRAIVEDLMPRHAKPGFDYVVIGRRGTLNRPFKALEDDMRIALNKLGTYQDATPSLQDVKA